jgi:hypothetical protein
MLMKWELLVPVNRRWSLTVADPATHVPCTIVVVALFDKMSFLRDSKTAPFVHATIHDHVECEY